MCIRDRTVATLGKPGDPAKPINISHNVTEMALEPVQIFEYDMITEEDVFTNANPAVFVAESAQSIINNKNYIRGMKLEGLKRRVARRIELMLAQLASEGKITYNDGVRNIEVDFNVSAENYSLTSTTDVYKDLLDIADEIRKKGHAPNLILVSPDVEKALLNNTKVEKYINKQGFNLAVMRMENYPNARAVIELKGLPTFYVYFGEYVDESGNVKSYIPDGKIIVLSTEVFRLGYGAIVNFKVDKNGNPIMTDVIVYEDIVNDGNAKALYVLSKPLPYILNAGAMKILNVTIS